MPVNFSLSIDLCVSARFCLLCSCVAIISRQLFQGGFVIINSHFILLFIMQEEMAGRGLGTEAGWALSEFSWLIVGVFKEIKFEIIVIPFLEVTYKCTHSHNTLPCCKFNFSVQRGWHESVLLLCTCCDSHVIPHARLIALVVKIKACEVFHLTPNREGIVLTVMQLNAASRLIQMSRFFLVCLCPVTSPHSHFHWHNLLLPSMKNDLDI